MTNAWSFHDMFSSSVKSCWTAAKSKFGMHSGHVEILETFKIWLEALQWYVGQRQIEKARFFQDIRSVKSRQITHAWFFQYIFYILNCRKEKTLHDFRS